MELYTVDVVVHSTAFSLDVMRLDQVRESGDFVATRSAVEMILYGTGDLEVV